MAFLTAEVKIPQLMQNVRCHLYYPTDLPDEVGNEVKGVITLLHGMSNTGGDWMMMSAACRYAADNGYILIAPDGGNSFFIDMAYGPPWHTILTQFLPQQLDRIFKIPRQRESNYIVGLSMGGYGALLAGLRCPQQYAAIGSFSGAVNFGGMAQMAGAFPALRGIYTPLLGEDLHLPEDMQLVPLAKKAAALPEGQRPRIFCTCGTQDDAEGMILTQNRAFAKEMHALPLDYVYAEWDGVHEWNFWDRSLAEFIGFIQNSDYGLRKRGDWAAEEARA